MMWSNAQLASASADSQLQVENTGFDLQFVESVDVKPVDMEGQSFSIFIEKNLRTSGPTQLKPMLFKGQV